jgi:tryptophanyl-tRNA synthetase
LQEVRNLYLHGGLAYGALKQELAELILSTFAEPRRKYAELINDHAYLDAVMANGAEKARAIAQPVLARMRRAVGLDR